MIVLFALWLEEQAVEEEVLGDLRMRGVEAGQPGRDPGQRLPLRRTQHLRHLLQLVLARREKMKKVRL